MMSESSSSSPDRLRRGGSSSDEAASPRGVDDAEELRLAAEMGQMLIAQKRELQTELDAVRGAGAPLLRAPAACPRGCVPWERRAAPLRPVRRRAPTCAAPGSDARV